MHFAAAVSSLQHIVAVSAVHADEVAAADEHVVTSRAIQRRAGMVCRKNIIAHATQKRLILARRGQAHFGA